MRRVLALSCLLLVLCALAQGDELQQVSEAFTPSPEFQDWLTDLAREHIPHQYEKRKNWGNTSRVASGLSIRLDDGQIKTHRKFREANDGRWTMYRAELVEPGEKFAVRVLRMEEVEGGLVGMDLEVVARLRVFGRQSLWESGVQVFSISAEAEANVRLSARADVALRIDPLRFPPEVSLKPKIAAARLDIPDFRLRRVGQFDGPVIRSLSSSAREVLEDKLADDNRELAAKLNKQLAKQEGKLKLSLADVMKTKFGSVLEKSSTTDSPVSP